MEKVFEVITDQVCIPVAGHAKRKRDGRDRPQAHLRRLREFFSATLSLSDLKYVTSYAANAKPAKWPVLGSARSQKPEGTVTLRTHYVVLTGAAVARLLVFAGLLVTQRQGLLSLRREHAVETRSVEPSMLP